MQKRHFEFVAGVIREARDHMPADQRHAFDVNVIAPAIGRLRQANPSFDRGRFERACGMEG